MSVTPFVSLTVEEFEQYLQQHPEAQLVDVRTSMEYAEGHLSGSINIDVLSPTFWQKPSNNSTPNVLWQCIAVVEHAANKQHYFLCEKGIS